MIVEEIKNLPKEFDFKSNINRVAKDLIYHAVEEKHRYVVTADGHTWTFPKEDFRRSLWCNDFTIV